MPVTWTKLAYEGDVVTKALFTAHTVLYATSGSTPVALTVTEQTLVGRLTGGNIAAVAVGIGDDEILQVDDATPPSDGQVAVFTAAGIEGQTPAEVAATMALDDIGVPDAAVDFNLQQATGLVVFTVANETARDALNAAATEVAQLCYSLSEGTLAICTAST